MGKMPIALQIYSVRDQAKADLLGTLKEISAMGYQGVEFFDTDGLNTTPEKAAELCAQVGLEVVGIHYPHGKMDADPQGSMNFLSALGTKYVVIPYMEPKHFATAEGMEQVIASVRSIAEAAKSANMTLLYHNHDFEYTPHGNRHALDILYQEVPAELLQCEIDTCWTKAAGLDPASYVRKYRGRVPLLHLKDFVGRGKEDLYVLEGQPAVEVTGEGKFDFRPLGMGRQDIPSIVTAAKESGVKWLVVEQDEVCLDLSAMDCARKSIEYLQTVN